MDEKRIPAQEDALENDLCDLDASKICDNCCKCLVKDDADYCVMSATFDPESMRIYYADEEDEEFDCEQSDLPPLEIDPALLLEWEEKLRLEELADRVPAGDGGERPPRHDPQQLYARRKKRERP